MEKYQFAACDSLDCIINEKICSKSPFTLFKWVLFPLLMDPHEGFFSKILFPCPQRTDKLTGLVLISFSFVYFLLMFVYIIGVLTGYQVLYIHYLNFCLCKQVLLTFFFSVINSGLRKLIHLIGGSIGIFKLIFIPKPVILTPKSKCTWDSTEGFFNF